MIWNVNAVLLSEGLNEKLPNLAWSTIKRSTPLTSKIKDDFLSYVYEFQINSEINKALKNAEINKKGPSKIEFNISNKVRWRTRLHKLIKTLYFYEYSI
jgi:hypothetical protein